MSRVRVKGHRTYSISGKRRTSFTIWGWECPRCEYAGGSGGSWREEFDEALDHARRH